jgi:hypothetical protein
VEGAWRKSSGRHAIRGTPACGNCAAPAEQPGMVLLVHLEHPQAPLREAAWPEQAVAAHDSERERESIHSEATVRLAGMVPCRRASPLTRDCIYCPRRRTLHRTMRRPIERAEPAIVRHICTAAVRHCPSQRHSAAHARTHRLLAHALHVLELDLRNLVQVLQADRARHLGARAPRARRDAGSALEQQRRGWCCGGSMSAAGGAAGARSSATHSSSRR